MSWLVMDHEASVFRIGDSYRSPTIEQLSSSLWCQEPAWYLERSWHHPGGPSCYFWFVSQFATLLERA